MPASDSRGRLRFSARSYESLALSEPLRFEPPEQRAGGEYWWRLLQYAFPSLPDPEGFPPLPPVAVNQDLDRICRRFFAATRELAGYSFLSHPSRMSVTPAQGQEPEKIQVDFPANDVLRGFAALFRQLNTDDGREQARFVAVQAALGRASLDAADEVTQARTSALKEWRRAHNRMHAFTLKVLVGQRLRGEKRLAQNPLPGERGPTPRELIAIYNYGEQIHWGDHRSTLEAWEADPYQAARRRMDFFESITGLAHLYIGFGVLVGTALTLEGTP